MAYQLDPTTLCEQCASGALFTDDWRRPDYATPAVLLSWSIQQYDRNCFGCRFIDRQIDEHNELQAELSSIALLARTYVAIRDYIDGVKAANVVWSEPEEVSRDDPTSRPYEHDGSSDCLVCNPLTEQNCRLDVVNGDIWKLSKALSKGMSAADQAHTLPSDPPLISSLPFCEALLKRMDALLQTHDESSSCAVCLFVTPAASGQSSTSEEFFKRMYDMSISARRELLLYHPIPSVPVSEIPERSGRDRIAQRVELILENHGSWRGISLHEYTVDESKIIIRRPQPQEEPDIDLGEVNRLAEGLSTIEIPDESAEGLMPDAAADADLRTDTMETKGKASIRDLSTVAGHGIQKMLDQVKNSTEDRDSMLPVPSGSFSKGQQSKPSRSSSPAASNSRMTDHLRHLRRTYRHPSEQFSFLPVGMNPRGGSRAVSEEVDSELVQQWLSTCQEQHPSCAKSDSIIRARQELNRLILIDTEESCLRTFTSGPVPPYFALSYVWGNVLQPTLSTLNLSSWHQEGSLEKEDIPQTIFDAMQFTQIVGLRYLWVDAMCIVQDDIELREIQIRQMWLIYQQAEATLVAAAGSNCTYGICGISEDGDRVEHHSVSDFPDFSLAMLPSQVHWTLEMSPWRKRGWTFQEELCSRRSIVFLPNVMLFCCFSAVWRDDIYPPTDGGVEAGASTRDDDEQRCFRSLVPIMERMDEEPSQRVNLFRSLVRGYLQRNLSRMDDIENAFAGVAGILEPILGKLFHGIPEPYFGEILESCWFLGMNLRPRVGFPSWSWTGWLYSSEQADAGIDIPAGSVGETTGLLQFFKIGYRGPVALENGPNSGSLVSIRGINPDIEHHFVTDQEEMHAWYLANQVTLSSRTISRCIFFHTSMAYLELRAPSNLAFVGSTREHRVLHPAMGTQVSAINLPHDFIAQHGNKQMFIVVAHNIKKQAFRLMMVRPAVEDGVLERLNVTIPGRLVAEDDWWTLGPCKMLVFMK